MTSKAYRRRCLNADALSFVILGLGNLMSVDIKIKQAAAIFEVKRVESLSKKRLSFVYFCLTGCSPCI